MTTKDTHYCIIWSLLGSEVTAINSLKVFRSLNYNYLVLSIIVFYFIILWCYYFASNLIRNILGVMREVEDLSGGSGFLFLSIYRMAVWIKCGKSSIRFVLSEEKTDATNQIWHSGQCKSGLLGRAQVSTQIGWMPGGLFRSQTPGIYSDRTRYFWTMT